MSDTIVVVNGPPGAGKTTLCTRLGRTLGMPVIAKDAVKESLAEIAGVPLPTGALGALSSDVVWELVSQIASPVIVESFWLVGRDDAFFRAGLTTGRVDRGVEVWCSAPTEVMRARFLTRDRHFAHDDANRLDEWEHNARIAAPISDFPVLRVDTGGPVDVTALAAEIRAALDL